jgi:hypothetical protein
MMNKIKLTEAAIRNDEQLLPNHKSKLQKTDPDFKDIYAPLDGFVVYDVVSSLNSDQCIGQ